MWWYFPAAVVSEKLQVLIMSSQVHWSCVSYLELVQERLCSAAQLQHNGKRQRPQPQRFSQVYFKIVAEMLRNLLIHTEYDRFLDTCFKAHNLHMQEPAHYTSQLTAVQDAVVLELTTWTTSRKKLVWKSTNSWSHLKIERLGVNLWSHVLIHSHRTRERAEMLK